MAKEVHLVLGKSERANDCEKLVGALAKLSDKNKNVYLMGLIERASREVFDKDEIESIKRGDS